MDSLTAVSALSEARVAVIGDLLLDEYIHGVVDRISPEAPVPVLHISDERCVPGGAANVAANVAALGGRVRLVGVIGADTSGATLGRLLAAQPGIEAEPLVCAEHPTVIKTRFVAGQQQIVRVDREWTTPYPTQTQAKLIAAAEEAIAAATVVVLSDYGKGVLCDAVLQAALACARAAGKPVVVDPKRRRFDSYRGADYITPNRKELLDATGLPCSSDADALAAAAAAQDQCGAAILLTRSERGMSLFRLGEPPIHIAAQAREVFDVSGAGDTVVAGFSLGLAALADPASAMRIANAAAGVVVGKRGTAACSAEELREALASRARGRRRSEGANVADGPISLGDAVALRETWRGQGLTVGFTNGCFDLLHPGHIAILRAAAEACDRLIVGLNSDASVASLKGPQRPVQAETARAQVLLGIKGVDAVVLFADPTPLALIQALRPDLLVKGADYTEDTVVGADLVKATGGRVLLAPLVAGHSTTALVSRLRADSAT